ncbi:glucokinase regulatory protein isoform X3 [Kryptolebias marmoratus]|uniref:glucokinase regulatory protein isoform X3 n=1 Tax=Kryptolebias marmoratus TaxID=37003 RepID=UPI000D52FC7E|nr:glucokinase regulatory protein isoform X3 [Kryptolebias marmoratus]
MFGKRRRRSTLRSGSNWVFFFNHAVASEEAGFAFATKSAPAIATVPEATRYSPSRRRQSADYEPFLPVSEKSNPLTRDMDRASPDSIVRMLQACDTQMFRKETGATHQDPQDSLVVLSGCGTSGRLAFFITSGFNRALRQLNRSEIYAYIIAGGDKALFSSQEAPEDDPKLGTLSLKQACEGKRRVLFIGISCGLSAPFVAGQLDFCLQNPEVYTPVLVGFNPTHQARDEPIPGCSFTFRSVAERMRALAKRRGAFLLNPVVGPEAVSGSSRMKGGSATKILLEVVLSAAHAATFSSSPITDEGILQHIRAYERTLDVTYSQRDGMAALVEAAGRSLQRGRRVRYLGWGSLGLLGLVDASECKPTFGADPEDVRGFVGGGYAELDNAEGPLNSLGPAFRVSHEDFLDLVLPGLTDEDAVLLVYTRADEVSRVVKLARRVREKTSNLHAVYHQTDKDTAVHQDEIDKLCSSTLTFTWTLETPASWSLLYMQWELATKLVLNAVSTGAHVLKGKIYQNYMIDLQVSNSKLYRRATRLLQKLSGLPEPRSEEALLKTIYQMDELTADVTSGDVKTHIRVARNHKKVVPLALVCLLTGCSIKEAESRLEQKPIVREAVEECLSKPASPPGSGCS